MSRAARKAASTTSAQSSEQSNKALSKLAPLSLGTTHSGSRNRGKLTTDSKKNLVNDFTEEEAKLHPTSLQNTSFKNLRSGITKWVNSKLARLKLHITDANNDLSDGTLIAALLEELTGEHIVEWGSTTSDKGKAMNFIKIVKYLDNSLNIREDPDSWTRVGITMCDQYSALSLLVHISHAVGANLALPSNVSVAVMRAVNVDGVSKNKTSVHKITHDESLFSIDISTLTPMNEPVLYNDDVFDGLVDSPEKLEQVTEVSLEGSNGCVYSCLLFS